LNGNTSLTTSIPTHYTKPDKYEILQERYLPEMFKMNMVTNDLSPDVLSEFNKCVAKGFTFLEDMANQLIDLMDSNSTPESMLGLLASSLGVRLKSTDPTLWRRQIKRAVPLYKKKGTLRGITEAFAQSGMRLVNFVKLWQVTSDYTWQEMFCASSDGESEFILSKKAIIEADPYPNYEIYLRESDATQWTQLTIAGNVTFSNDGCTSVDDLGMSSGIKTTSGQMQLILPPETVEIGAFESNDIIRVFCERKNYELTNPVLVDITSPGLYNDVASLAGGTITAGAKVKSYYVHFDQVGTTGPLPNNLRNGRGSITFTEPIIGVIVTSAKIVASNAELKSPTTAYSASAGLEMLGSVGYSQGALPDTISISEDMKTLYYDCYVSNVTDDIRIITECSGDACCPTTLMTWTGSSLSEGDCLKVVYKINEVPTPAEQAREDYIRSLSLMDQRDERDQDYPLKNWNTKVIAEDDPEFDTIINEKNPYSDLLVFGKVRTEFPYSENIYNMEEYNGSKRDSINPCDIDKDFIDPCSRGISSKYNIDLEIEKLSDNKLLEALDILKEFMPFHAVLHSMNVLGSHQDFVSPPLEKITALVRCTGEEITVADPPQTIFYRNMAQGYKEQWTRETLASMSSVYSATDGKLSNARVTLFAPNISLEHAEINEDSSLVKFEIYDGAYSPSTSMVLSNFSGRTATVTGVSEPPLDQGQFTFRISNEILNKTTDITITKQYTYELNEKTIEYLPKGIEVGWTVTIDGSDYTILEITTDNKLVLSGGPAASATGVEYEIYDGDDELVYAGTRGIYVKSEYGLVDFPNDIEYHGETATSIDDISSYIRIGDYLAVASGEYRICNITGSHQFVVESYSASGAAGIAGKVYRRMVDSETGYFHYEGIKLEASVNMISALGIDETIEADTFKQNYLIYLADYNSPSGGSGSYYSIDAISEDGLTLTLGGPPVDLGVSVQITSVNFEVYWFEKITWDESTIVPKHFEERRSSIPVYDWDDVKIGEELAIYVPGHDFDFIDRRGNEVIDRTEEVAAVSMRMSSKPIEKMLNAAKRDNVKDSITQQEKISLTIEKRK
jgi:hypothetical protein